MASRFEQMKPALDILFDDLTLDNFVLVADEGLSGTSCEYCGIRDYCDHEMGMDISMEEYEKEHPLGNGVICSDVLKKYLSEEV